MDVVTYAARFWNILVVVLVLFPNKKKMTSPSNKDIVANISTIKDDATEAIVDKIETNKKASDVDYEIYVQSTTKGQRWEGINRSFSQDKDSSLGDVDKNDCQLDDLTENENKSGKIAENEDDKDSINLQDIGQLKRNGDNSSIIETNTQTACSSHPQRDNVVTTHFHVMVPKGLSKKSVVFVIGSINEFGKWRNGIIKLKKHERNSLYWHSDSVKLPISTLQGEPIRYRYYIYDGIHVGPIELLKQLILNESNEPEIPDINTGEWHEEPVIRNFVSKENQYDLWRSTEKYKLKEEDLRNHYPFLSLIYESVTKSSMKEKIMEYEDIVRNDSVILGLTGHFVLKSFGDSNNTIEKKAFLCVLLSYVINERKTQASHWLNLPEKFPALAMLRTFKDINMDDLPRDVIAMFAPLICALVNHISTYSSKFEWMEVFEIAPVIDPNYTFLEQINTPAYTRRNASDFFLSLENIAKPYIDDIQHETTYVKVCKALLDLCQDIDAVVFLWKSIFLLEAKTNQHLVQSSLGLIRKLISDGNVEELYKNLGKIPDDFGIDSATVFRAAVLKQLSGTGVTCSRNDLDLMLKLLDDVRLGWEVDSTFQALYQISVSRNLEMLQVFTSRLESFLRKYSLDDYLENRKVENICFRWFRSILDIKKKSKLIKEDFAFTIFHHLTMIYVIIISYHIPYEELFKIAKEETKVLPDNEIFNAAAKIGNFKIEEIIEAFSILLKEKFGPNVKNDDRLLEKIMKICDSRNNKLHVPNKLCEDTVFHILTRLHENLTKMNMDITDDNFHKELLNSSKFWVCVLMATGSVEQIHKNHVYINIVQQAIIQLATKLKDKSIKINILKGVLDYDDKRLLPYFATINGSSTNITQITLNSLRNDYETYLRKLDDLNTFYRRFCVDTADAQKYINDLELKSNSNNVTLEDVLDENFWKLHKLIITAAKRSYIYAKSQTFKNVFEKQLKTCKMTLTVELVATKFMPMTFSQYDQIRTEYEDWQKLDCLKISSFWKDAMNIDNELELMSRGMKWNSKDNLKTAISYLASIKQCMDRLGDLEKTLGVFKVQNVTESWVVKVHNKLRKEPLLLGDLFKAINEMNKHIDNFNDNCWEMVRALSYAGDFVNWLREIADSDLRNLFNGVAEKQEKEETVGLLIEVKQFLVPLMNELKLFKESSATQMIIYKFLEQIRGIILMNDSLPDKISKCCSNSLALQNIYFSIFDRGEKTKEFIRDATTRGSYKFSRDKNHDKCVVKLSCKDKNGEIVSYDFSGIQDLQGQALLIAKQAASAFVLRLPVENGNSLEHGTDELMNFVQQVYVVNQIVKYASYLMELGHFSYRKWEKSVNSAEINSMLENLREDLQIWENDMKRAQDQHYYLTFYTARHILAFYDYFNYPVNQENREICEILLQFVSKKAKLLTSEQSIKIDTDKRDFYEVFCIIGKKLSEIFAQTSKCTKKIEFKLEPIISDVVYNGKLFVATCTNAYRVPNIVMSLYANHGSYPEPWQLLMCRVTTTAEELSIFIKRCFLAAKNGYQERLFCIAGLESLELELQYNLVNDVRNFQRTETDYYLALICCQENGIHHHILDQFSEYVHTTNGLNEDSMKNIYEKLCPKVFCVTSELSGQGKTEYVRQASFKVGLISRSLFIGDNVHFDELVSKLSEFKLKPIESLHLNVMPVNNPYDVNGLFFEFLTLGVISNKKGIVRLPKQHVYIEISSTHGQHLLDSIPIVQCLKRKHLRWNVNNLIVTNELNSQIQVVSHYLDAHDRGELDERDISFVGYNALKKPINAGRSRELIQKYFLDKNDKNAASYRFVEIFLNVFADQLIRLSSSSFFNIHNLRLMVADNRIRTTLLETLLEVSKDFATRSINTKAAQLQSTQNTSNDQLETIVQWDSTNHLLVFFLSQTPDSICALYRERSKVPLSVKRLLKSQEINDFMEPQKWWELEDYHTMPANKLLDKLELIARTSTGERKLPKYALSADNLLKMALILLRARANIPVVICGEAGCGKTSLISFLSTVVGVQFKVLSLHAGIREDQICEFIEKSTKDAVNGQIWLFFDEINTCNHIGLLADLIAHRILSGRIIHHNIRLFAACNPYRLRTKNASSVGLEKSYQEQSKLVYQVHPLPNQILDYVWDYGVLKAEEERIYLTPHQGSASSTSDGILKVFEKAERHQRASSKKFLVQSVVLLDEVGLAETSRFNPLKVLHSLLEPNYPEEGPIVSVIGISNWRLDNSKSSRALLVQRPKFDLEDLTMTATMLLDDRTNAIDDLKLKKLAEAYLNYEKNQKFKNFHGLRDYYALVKSLSGTELTMRSLELGLSRNFGGTDQTKVICEKYFGDVLKSFGKSKYYKYTPTPLLQLVNENLSRKDTRHLMIIGKSDSLVNILTYHMRSQQLDPIILCGSQFPDDDDSDYMCAVLSRIMMCVEAGRPLILTDLDVIYGSLYDLWNQNYITLRNHGDVKYFARVALGAYSNPMLQVHPDFKCILVMDESKLARADPPLLNRFEKQRLTFNDILTKRHMKLCEELSIWVRQISTLNGMEFQGVIKEFTEKDIFVRFDREETIQSLVFNQCTSDQDMDYVIILERCKERLMAIASSDGVIRARQSILAAQNPKEVAELNDIYFNNGLHDDIESCLRVLLGEKDNRENREAQLIIINTFSNINTDISTCLDSLVTCQVDKLSTFKTEAQLQDRIKHFWFDSDVELLVLQCDLLMINSGCIKLAKFIIEQIRTKYLEKKRKAEIDLPTKHACIILHIYRDQSEASVSFDFTCGWNLVTVGTLTRQEKSLPILLGKSIKDVMNLTLPFEEIFQQEYLVDEIPKHPRLIEAFKQKIFKWLDENTTANWQLKAVSEKKILYLHPSLSAALRMYIHSLVRNQIAKLIYALEKLSALKTLLIIECENNVGNLLEFWYQTFADNNVISTDTLTNPKPDHYRLVNGPYNLDFPFSYYLVDQINNCKKFYLEDIKILEEDKNNVNKVTGQLLNGVLTDNFRRFQNILSTSVLKHVPIKEAATLYSKDFLTIISSGDNFKLLDLLLRRRLGQKLILDPVRLHTYWWAKSNIIIAELQLAKLCPSIVKEINEDINDDFENLNKDLPDIVIRLMLDRLQIIRTDIKQFQQWQLDSPKVLSLCSKLLTDSFSSSFQLLRICNDLISKQIITFNNLKIIPTLIDYGQTFGVSDKTFVDYILKLIDKDVAMRQDFYLQILNNEPLESPVCLHLYHSLFSQAQPFPFTTFTILSIFRAEEKGYNGIFLAIIRNSNRTSPGLYIINKKLEMNQRDSQLLALCCDVLQNSFFAKMEISKLLELFQYAIQNLYATGAKQTALQLICSIALLKQFVNDLLTPATLDNAFTIPIKFNLTDSDGFIGRLNNLMRKSHPQVQSFKFYFLKILRDRGLSIKDLRQFRDCQQKTLPWLADLPWDNDDDSHLPFNPYILLREYEEIEYSIERNKFDELLCTISPANQVDLKIAFIGVISIRLYSVIATRRLDKNENKLKNSLRKNLDKMNTTPVYKEFAKKLLSNDHPLLKIQQTGECGRTMQTRKCPTKGCALMLGGQNHTSAPGQQRLNANQITTEDKKGYLVEQGTREHAKNVRKMTPISYRILHLFVHVLITASESSTTIFNNVNPVEYCLDHVIKDWEVLKALLNCNNENLALILHDILLSMAQDNSSLNSMLRTKEERTNWELYFTTKYIKNRVNNPNATALNLYSRLQRTKEDIKKKHCAFEAEINETMELDDAYHEERLPRLWRRIGSTRFDNFSAYYANNSESYPVIAIFFKYEKNLPHLKHLYHLVKFSHILTSRLSYRIKRDQALNMTFQEFIDSDENADKFNEEYDNFADSWNTIMPLIKRYQCHEIPANKPVMNLNCPIIYGLIDNKDEGLFLCAALEYLVDLQNRFLYEVSNIPPRACYSLKFLEQQEGINSDVNNPYNIRAVRLEDARQENFINYVWDPKLLEHSQCNLEIGSGKEIAYDLRKIEAELVQDLILNKTYLEPIEQDGHILEPFPYYMEMFQGSTTILHDIKEMIKQEPIPHNMLAHLTGNAPKFSSNSKRVEIMFSGNESYLLSSLELLLCFIKRTVSSDGNMTIKEYIQQWIKLSVLSENKELKKVLNIGLKLKHIIALYELVEEKVANIVMESVSSRYKSELTSQMESQILFACSFEDKNAKTERLIPVKAFTLALKRFVLRKLSVESIHEDHPLSVYLTEASIGCWPDDIDEDLILDTFPKSLLIKNAHAAYHFAKNRVETIETERKNVEKQSKLGCKIYGDEQE
ncbi:10104_t:CDS:10 [Acaulospora colombiana]|uniref:10104_t:CDS:1 n=1 Tax=Acaulospora colombiana TaxID=27376 RepID=A0ACA9JW32_9GLOM|nr:10104_t:CDS:10 [Acaulospora colombiana]